MKRLILAIVVVGLGVLQSAMADCCATQVVNGVAWCYRTYAGSNEARLEGKWVHENGKSFYRPVIDSATRGAVAVPATLGGHVVAYITTGAFANCTNLTSITIPAGVEYVDSSAFDGCDALMLFSVASGNANYASKGGLLLDKEQTTLLRCPAALSSVTIPSTVTTISSYAFSGCSSLSSLDIPPRVKTIGYRAFEGCYSLNRVTGGYGLVSVENDAFADTALVLDAEEGPVRVGNIWVAYSGDLPSELVIPEGVTGVTFSLEGVSELTLPLSVKSSDAVHGFTGYAIQVPSLNYWLSFHAAGNKSSCTCCGDSFYEGDGYDLYFGEDLVTDVAIPGSITNVPPRCFYRCGSLTSVSLGEGIRSIGYEAFEDCENLETVSIPSTLVASFEHDFNECPNMRAFIVSSDNPRFATRGDGILYDKALATLMRCPRGKDKVTIPPSVTRIDARAFAECDRLEETITLPSSVREVGYRAFEGCEGLQTVLGGTGVREVGNDAFDNTPFVQDAADGPVTLGSTWVAYAGEVPETLVVPEGVTDIGFSIDNVKDLTLPSTFQPDWLNFYADVLRVPSVAFWLREGGNIYFSGGGGCCDCGSSTSAGYYLFAKGEQVTDVTIPGSMGKIPDSLFARCLSLTSVTVGEGVTTIGGSAFSGCANLSEMQLPDSLSRIGDSAFSGCSQLDFELPPFVDAIGEDALWDTLALENAVTAATGGMVYFGNWCFGFYDPDDEDSPSTITVKNGTRGIAACAFEYVRASKVALPASLVAIENHAFALTDLTSVTLPSGLKRLGYHAFASSKLATLPKLPATLEEVGYGVFKSCDSGVTPAYAKLPKGWIVQDGWLLGYKAYDYVYDAEEDAWYSADGDESECPERLAVPSGVKHIAVQGREDFYDLLELTLPNGLETIGKDAFYCAELNEVVIPASVTRLGSGAFAWADGPITFLGRPPEIELDDEGYGPFEEAYLGYFAAGTPGWTNGMTFAGLTMIARDDLEGPVTPVQKGVTFDSVDDIECAGGESISIPIVCTSESAVTYKTAGLPAGVKFDAKKMLVSGAPTVPGSYTVTITGTNKKKESATLMFKILVANFTSEYFSVDDELHFAPGAAIEPIDLSGCGLDFAAGDMLTVKGLPKGLSYNAKTFLITGTPTTPGMVTVTFTAKVKTTDENGRAKSVSSVATAQWTVDPLPVLTVTALDAEGDEADDTVGTVTGGGSYLAGKKVTLKATAKTGYVFAGWFGLDESRVGAVDLRNASVSYVTGTADEEVFAYFVPKSEDAASLAVSLMSPRIFDGGWTEYEEWTGESYVGVQTTQQVAVASLSLPTVKVTGLPAGLKFNSKTYEIYGVPTRAGDFTVTVKTTNASGVSVTERFDWTVLPLPQWAVGTFVGRLGLNIHPNGGECYDGGHETVDGILTMTVGTNGRISGKVQAQGKTYSFTASGFATHLIEETAYDECPMGHSVYGTSWWEEGSYRSGYRCVTCNQNYASAECVTVTTQWPRFVAEIQLKIGARQVTLPIYVEERGASEDEGTGVGCGGLYDENGFHSYAAAPATLCEWCLDDFGQTLSCRKDVATLTTRTYAKCLTGEDWPDELGEDGWLTVKASSTGRLTFVGRVQGNAVTATSELVLGELGEDELSVKSFLPIAPNKRTGFSGLTFRLDSIVSDGLMTDFDLRY